MNFEEIDLEKIDVPDRMRCKMVCDSVTYTKEYLNITLTPVTSGSAENKEFYRYTPGGKIELNVVNKNAKVFFEPGKNYYIDLISTGE